MHTSLTTSILLFGPPVAGTRLLQFDVAFAGTLWLLVFVLHWAQRHSKRPSPAVVREVFLLTLHCLQRSFARTLRDWDAVNFQANGFS